MIPNLDVDLLKTFLAIADNGSFTRAAEEVHKTQSAVSMQMKRLEELVGTPLFAKDGRMSRFTQDGERLVDYARRIVAINDEAIYAFAKPDLTGTIKFGTPDDYAERFLPEILARFARTHPMVTVDVECLGSGELFERCKRGEMDLSLVTHGCDILTEEPVRREKLVWVTSTRHLRIWPKSCRLRFRMRAAAGAAWCSGRLTRNRENSAWPIRRPIQTR